MEGQIGHLPAGDPRGDLDDERPAVVGDDQLRERDPVPQAQRAHGPQRDALRLLERVAEEPGGIGVDPADAEPDAVGAQPVGEQQRIRLPAARDHQPVQLEAVGEFLEDRLAGRRFRQRRVEVPLEVAERTQEEEAALASRVGRLQHGRKADRLGGCSGLAPDTDRRELRLRHPALGEAAAHRHLVRHQVRRLAADPGEAELVGDRGDDGHGPVGRDGQRPVHPLPPGDVDHGVDVDEVDHLRRVGLGQSGRLGVSVDRDDAQAELLRAEDRPPLVAPRADEENGLHVAGDATAAASRLDSLAMALTGKRILITGGAGFIGTTLARRLVDDNEIVAFDNLHRDALGGTDLADHPNFTFVQGDVLDAEGVTEVARGATHIVHAAAIAGVDTVLESPVRTMRVNLIGTYNALEAALATKETVERLIEFSTSEVFGTYAFRVDETSATTQGSVGEARWTYAVSKLAGEHMAHAYHQEFGLPTASVRPFNVYGPGQIGGGAIRAFIEAALAGRELVVHGDGSQIRAWCYVDDMVEGLLLALEHPNAVGESFNIGNARSAVTIFDLARRIRSLSGCPGELVFQPLHYLDVELRIPNVDKARTLLGFEAKVELDEGLERTIAWYRAKTPSSV